MLGDSLDKSQGSARRRKFAEQSKGVSSDIFNGTSPGKTIGFQEGNEAILDAVAKEGTNKEEDETLTLKRTWQVS